MAKSPTRSPDAPFSETSAPMFVLRSMTVATVAHVEPTSVIWPTRTPYSVMTQSPTSSSAFVPLLMVNECAQFEVVHATTLADSSVISLCFSLNSSSWRKRSFSSMAAAPFRASS